MPSQNAPGACRSARPFSPSLRRSIALSLAAALAALFISPAGNADEIDWGQRDRYSLGFMLGGPTGLMLEKNLPGGNAWDLGVGVVYGPGLRVHGDYLWTIAAAQPRQSDLFIRFQIGIGGLVGSLTHPCEFYGDFGSCNGNVYVGVRVPFDVELWPRAPLNFGLEVAPVIAFNQNGAGGFLDAFVFVRFVL